MTELISYLNLPTAIRKRINNLPEGYVYIGDVNKYRGINRSHKLANPFTITKYFTREMATIKYRQHLLGLIDKGHVTEETLLALDGKKLVSYDAAGNPCHGHVIIEMIEAIKANQFEQYKEQYRGN